MIYLIVSFIEIFVNNDVTSYDTFPAPSCKCGIKDKMIHFCVTLMEYSFFYKGRN